MAFPSTTSFDLLPISYIMAFLKTKNTILSDFNYIKTFKLTFIWTLLSLQRLDILVSIEHTKCFSFEVIGVKFVRHNMGLSSFTLGENNKGLA